MPDPYARLTRAVVEIGTQLRRIADAQTTAVADAADTPTTTPADDRLIQELRTFANQLDDADRADLLELIDQPPAPRGGFAEAREAVRIALGHDAAPQTPILFAGPAAASEAANPDAR